jgi:hypothetical protein
MKKWYSDHLQGDYSYSAYTEQFDKINARITDFANEHKLGPNELIITKIQKDEDGRFGH